MNKHSTVKLNVIKFIKKYGILLLAISLLASFGIIYQYNLNGEQWMPRSCIHAIRFCLLFVVMIIIAKSSMKFWYSWAYFLYFASIFLLLGVEAFGLIGMGAKRWINLYFLNLQPSELTKITAILALSRYYHELLKNEIYRHGNVFVNAYLVPLLIIFTPVSIVLKQPDLGTAVIIALEGIFLMFIVDKHPIRYISCYLIAALASPICWPFLHNYQKQRILIFLNPELAPFSTGYHILQSKIALGSGGFWGKGFLYGTQSKLNFLPEKHTDFIFSAICEEMGLLGGLSIITLYLYIIIFGLRIAMKAKSNFKFLMASSLSIMIALHMIINTAMVMGLLPVVGIPLQLISHGGSSMLTFMGAIGLILCADYRSNRF